jgi:hypothetical protein
MRATTSASSDINEGCPGDTAKWHNERRFSEVKMHNNNTHIKLLRNQGTVPSKVMCSLIIPSITRACVFWRYWRSNSYEYCNWM